MKKNILFIILAIILISTGFIFFSEIAWAGILLWSIGAVFILISLLGFLKNQMPLKETKQKNPFLNFQKTCDNLLNLEMSTHLSENIHSYREQSRLYNNLCTVFPCLNKLDCDSCFQIKVDDIFCVATLAKVTEKKLADFTPSFPISHQQALDSYMLLDYYVYILADQPTENLKAAQSVLFQRLSKDYLRQLNQE